MNKYKTSTLEVKRDIERVFPQMEKMNTAWQYLKYKHHSRTLESTFEELEEILVQRASERQGFEVVGDDVFVPSLFIKLSGSGPINKQIQKLIDKDTEKNVLYFNSIENFPNIEFNKNDFYEVESIISAEGLIDREKLLKSDLYNYSFLKLEYQESIINKINFIIKNRGAIFNETVLPDNVCKIVYALLNLDSMFLSQYNLFDFQGSVPKIIISNESKSEFSEAQAYAISLLNMLSFDIIITSKKGYADIENILTKDMYNIFYRIIEKEDSVDIPKSRTSSKIPGFRTNSTWKRIVAVFGYLIIFIFLISLATSGKSGYDRFISTLEFVLFIIPVFSLNTNFLGIRNKIFGVDRGKVWKKIILLPTVFIISLIIGGIFIGIANSLHSEEFKAASKMKSEAKKGNNINNNVLNERGQNVKNDNPGKELTVEELAKKKSCVVLIDAGDASGSGVVISKSGYVISNFHVIKDAKEIFAYFQNEEGDLGIKIKMNLISSDENRDLTLLKLDTKNSYSFITLAKPESIKDGQRVVAIGSPKGLINTISEGIVSSIRKAKEVTYIQTTAPINNGSSGGALLNLNGELIGITSSGIKDVGNLNFAIAVNDVLDFLKVSKITLNE